MILGPKKIWAQNNFWSKQNLLVKRNFCVQKNIWSKKKFWYEKNPSSENKNFVKKKFKPQIFLVRTFFNIRKINFGPKNNFGPKKKKILDLKLLWTHISIEPNIFRAQNRLIFFIQNFANQKYFLFLDPNIFGTKKRMFWTQNIF